MSELALLWRARASRPEVAVFATLAIAATSLDEQPQRYSMARRRRYSMERTTTCIRCVARARSLPAAAEPLPVGQLERLGRSLFRRRRVRCWFVSQAATTTTATEVSPSLAQINTCFAVSVGSATNNSTCYLCRLLLHYFAGRPQSYALACKSYTSASVRSGVDCKI